MTMIKSDNMRPKLRFMLMIGAAVGSLSLPSSAWAQTTTEEESPEGQLPNSETDNEIVVSGLRASLQSALDIRRRADVVLDGISSDDIGSTPDLNLGEALQRIPGVQINRDGSRRDATISVRGLPGNFTKTTVQGQSVASTSRGLSFNAGSPFGIFDSSIFNGANVVKSFTAETPSGGLASVVDLRINSALRRREGVVLRAEVNYEESTENFVPVFFGSVAKKFTDRFGVYAIAAYNDLDFRRDTFRVNNFNAFTTAQVAGFAAGTRATGNETVDTIGLNGPNAAFDIAPIGENGLANSVIFARDPSQIVQQDRGFRLSAAAGLAYEISDNLTFRLDGIYTRRDLESTTQDNLLTGVNGPNGNNTLVTPLSDPVFLGTFDFNLDQVEENVFLTPRVFASDANIAHANRFLPALEESFAIYPQFNFENDDWRLDIIGTYSEAVGIEQLSNFDFRVNAGPGSQADANNNGIDDRGTGNFFLVDTGVGDLNSIFFDAGIDPRLLTFQRGTQNFVTLGANHGEIRFNVPLTADVGAGFNGVSRFLIQGFNSQVDRDLSAIDFKLARKFENSIINEIGIGAYYSKENSDRRRIDLGALGSNVTALSSVADDQIFIPGDSVGSTVSSGSGFGGGFLPGAAISSFITLNIPLIRDLIQPVTRALPDGATFTPNLGNLNAAFPEVTNANTITIDEILAAAEIVPNSGGFLNRLDSATVRGSNIRNNFTSSRDNLELFGQVKFDFANTTEFPLRGNFGLRYIDTSLTGQTRSIALDFLQRVNEIRTQNGTPLLEFRDGAGDPEQANTSFSRFLPSVNLIYDITDNLTIRAAYYETFEAFDLAEFQPTPTTITVLEAGEDPDDPNAGVDRTIVNRSSLDILPRSSKGFDLGISWYNRPGGLVALGFFRKSLANEIVNFNNFCESGSSFSVLGQTFSDLQFSSANNCTFDAGNGLRENIRISFAANNPEPIFVTGFEGQIQQDLDFLPGLLGNTGFIVNATRVRVNGDNGVVLSRVAEFTYNLIGYYEDNLFQARLAWNFQGDVPIPDGGSFGGASRRALGRGQLDFSGAIRPIGNLEVRFEAFNITNTNRREFLGVESLLRTFQFEGRTLSLSATYRF